MKNLLSFKLQKDTQFLRKIKVLKYILEKNEPVSLEELANMVPCSMVILKDSIAAIEEQLSHTLDLIRYKENLVAIELKKNWSFDSMIKVLSRDTTLFAIIDGALHSKYKTIQKAINELHISRTTIYQYLKHINEELADYQIKLSGKNFEFVGKEENIRLFFFHFYIEFGDIEIIEDNVESCVTYYLNERNDNKCDNMRFCNFRFSIWLSIAKIRIKNKHFMTFPCDRSEEDKKLPAFVDDILIIEKLFNKMGLKNVPMDEVYWFHTSSLYSITYTTSEQSKGSQLMMRAKDLTKENIDNAKAFLSHLVHANTLEGLDGDKIISFLVNLSVLSRYSSAFEIVDVNLSRFVEQSQPKKYEKWLDLIKTKGEDYGYNFTHVEDVATSLAVFQSITVSIDENRKINVLCAFYGEAGFDQYLVDTSRLVMASPNINVIYYLEETLKVEDIKGKDADLVISNYDLKNLNAFDVPFIRMANIPNIVDWTSVREAVEGLLAEEDD